MLLKFLIPIISVLIPFSAYSFNIGDFGEAVKQIKKIQEQAKELQKAVKERPFTGEVVIDDVSKPWYFKMEWFDAAACSRIYYQVNNGKPVFLVEFVGTKPPTGAPIPIEGLKKGDRVRFLVETHWDGRWIGPVSSQDPRFFKAFKRRKRLYYFQFEDAAGADMAYNDGAFLFYQEGDGAPPNRNLRILSYEAFRQGSGFLLTGKVKVNTPGYVKSEIEIRDNHWNVERLIENGFRAEKPGTYEFKRLVQLSPAPFHTSFWRVSLNGESDSRVRGLGDCTPTNSVVSQKEKPIAFGSAEKNPFVFEGTIYAIPPGTDRLPDFSKLKPIGKIYSAVLNVTPRDFSSGFPGVSDRFEWFAIDYKGKIYIPETRTYTFSLLSDDGAKLIINGKTVIDNDGIHPPTKKTGSVKLTKGFHTVEVQYFQGPRYQVALVLSLVKNGREVPFDIREFAPAQLEESQCETKITMGSGILFDFNSYQLKPEAMKLLDTIYSILSGMDYRKIVVEGHTDNVGSADYNFKLSKERAQSVANYLIAKGIPREKITVFGYGETKPLYPNDTPEHRAKNRRVEIKVLKECERGK